MESPQLRASTAARKGNRAVSALVMGVIVVVLVIVVPVGLQFSFLGFAVILFVLAIPMWPAWLAGRRAGRRAGGPMPPGRAREGRPLYEWRARTPVSVALVSGLVVLPISLIATLSSLLRCVSFLDEPIPDCRMSTFGLAALGSVATAIVAVVAGSIASYRRGWVSARNGPQGSRAGTDHIAGPDAALAPDT
jgi:hypothetical protein